MGADAARLRRGQGDAMKEQWKRDIDDNQSRPPVKFGKKARAWLCRVLTAELFTPSKTTEGFFDRGTIEWDQWAVDILIDWYLQKPERYVSWEDDKRWCGARFSCGQYVLNKKSVLADIEEGIKLVDIACDNYANKTLDDWLLADIEGTLCYKGDVGGMSRIPEGMRARTKTKRRCLGCGRLFEKQRNAKRCIDCRRAKATQRTPTAQHAKES